MKFRFKPTNKKFTVLIVPEGTSPVFRFKMRFALLLSLLVSAMAVIILALVLALVNRSNTSRIVMLEAELTSSEDRLQSTVDDKEKAIDELLTELIALSEKSKTIESKMVELENLEAELKAITTGSRISPASTKINQDKEAPQDGGVGGESVPLSDAEVRSLIDETKASITASLNEMPELQARLEQTKVNVEKYKEMMRILPTYWPTDSTRITSHFGKRSDPFSNRLTSHNGLDIGGNTGDPVYAAADGKVTDTGYSSARGNYVTVAHPSGLQTIYMHLQKGIAAKGDTVKQGDTIGLLGSTGRSTGPHLHIEVVKGGTPVDPLNYLTIPGEDEAL
ncbi:peptidoglycan DD-metalloendopeptidase family protein [Paenibacillus sp. M1]|uniref:Peptidoglycan DD-metalloendopeptidase family protein n=1 Tax=Paenibacillus haidiansis TaxID=1574488 RepID=A0ABU7VV06_9BACL